MRGYRAQVDAGKRAGAGPATSALTASSPGYEINDLGFQTSTDRIVLDPNVTYEHTRPWEPAASLERARGARQRVDVRLGARAPAELLDGAGRSSSTTGRQICSSITRARRSTTASRAVGR
jgi:hypothetical protein